MDLNLFIQVLKTFASKFASFGEGSTAQTSYMQQNTIIEYNDAQSVNRWGSLGLAPTNCLAVFINTGGGTINKIDIGNLTNYADSCIVTKTNLVQGEYTIFSNNYTVTTKLDAVNYFFKDYTKTAISGEDVMLVENAQAKDSKYMETIYNSHTHLLPPYMATIMAGASTPIIPVTLTLTADVPVTGGGGGVISSGATISATLSFTGLGGVLITPVSPTSTLIPTQQSTMPNNSDITTYTSSDGALINDKYKQYGE